MRNRFLRSAESFVLPGLVFLLLLFAGCRPNQPIRVLVVSGGHAYDTVHFMQMWASMPELTIDTLIQPAANQLYTQEAIQAYDVLVFYDMYQAIAEDEKSAFLSLLEQGTGVLFLHHSLASYQTWPEYPKILGGHYVEGHSGYLHDQDIGVIVTDPDHPVTRNLDSFIIHDEIYFDVRMEDGVQPLLTTTHPGSMKLLGWTHRYGRSGVVYLQPGHDNNAFSNPAYRQLILQAIRFLAK